MKMKSSPCSWLLFLALGLLLTTPAAEAKRFYDITHEIHDNLPAFEKANGVGQVIFADNGTLTTSTYKAYVHLGTHVDAPSHVKDLIPLGIDVPALNLETLMGPVLVVRVPDNANITGKVLRSLHLPKGIDRVIFKTKNTDRRLMHQRAFTYDYTGFTADGAQWLVDNTKIKFVGIDYMSIAAFNHLVPVHEILLRTKVIIPVECLNLDGIEPGQYDVYCLPMKLKAEGAPTRCILMQ